MAGTRTVVDDDLCTLVRDVDVDQEFLRRVITHLTGIGSSPLGFRTTGTPEDRAVAEYVADQMRAIGLSGVAIEPVTVDAWRFLGAGVTVGADRTSDVKTAQYDAVSFGGVIGTGPDGVTGRLVDIADGRRTRLDAHDLAGTLVLLDWKNAAVSPSVVVLELAERGVLGVILNCPAGGPFYQSPTAVGSFDAHWPAGAPPMVLVGKENAAELRRLTRARDRPVTLTLHVELERNAAGYNVVGHLEGDRPGPVVVGAHHDAWFRGAFDNTSGVAVMLAMARALVRSSFRPRHTICFTSRTGEEYGIADSTFDWCIGAWRQVEVTHPEWDEQAPFHLCVEASGHPGLRSVIEAPVELARWARAIGRAGEGEGWTPTGWRVAPPVAGTEQWPLLIAGIPGIACYAWEKSFAKTDYHTQLDTIELLDFDILSAQTRLYLLALVSADRDPDAIVDHAARARQLATIGRDTGHAGLAAAAVEHARASGRSAFTPVGRGLFALDQHAALAYPHDQSARDLRGLHAARSAVDAGDLGGAARALRRVGHHYLFPYLGPSALATYAGRLEPAALTRTWAARSNLSPSVALWAVLATLAGQRDARPFGAWVCDELDRAIEHTRHQLDQRLDAMTRSVTTRRSAP